MATVTTIDPTTKPASTATNQPKTTFWEGLNNSANLLPGIADSFVRVMDAVRGTSLSEAEQDLAIQQEFFNVQMKTENDRRKTIYIMAGICVVAVLATVFFTRKNS